jgi:hypothetical protein
VIPPRAGLHNANVRCEPWPEVVSEERQIDADNNGDHDHHVKRGSYRAAHHGKTSLVTDA